MWCELWGQPWGRIAMLIWKLCVWMSSQSLGKFKGMNCVRNFLVGCK